MVKPCKTRYISLILILVLFTNIMPTGIGQAAGVANHTMGEAASLMYLSDAILTPESELDDTPETTALNSVMPGVSTEVDTKPLLARIIHAKKMERNDLDANCRLLTSQLRAQGKDCEADRVQSYCQTKRSEINSQIGYFHKLRGDQRKLFTKIWHNIKRKASNFWYRIGPMGRNFLRSMGQDALQIVISGGSLSGNVLRGLVKNHIKTAARERIKEVVYQGIQRLLEGQLAIAVAAGVDICSEEEILPSDTSPEEDQISPSEATPQYTLTADDIAFNWHSLLPRREQGHSCGSLWENEDEFFQPIEFTLTIDIQNQTLAGRIEDQRKIVNYTEGVSGPLASEQNQSFTVILDGPYQISEPDSGRVVSYQGTAQITLSMDGKRLCGYWECPGGIDCVWKEYWVTGADKKSLTSPYELSVVSYDGVTGILAFWINTISWGENSEFSLSTEDHDLSTEELDALWKK